MPPSSKQSGRKRSRSDRNASEKSPERGPCASSSPKPLKNQRSSAHQPSKEKISEDKTDYLTRRRAQHLGKELVSPEDEPERILRNRHRQNPQNTATETKNLQMDRSGSRRDQAQDDDDNGRQGLQGLLRRLGAGFEDVFPMAALGGASSSSRIKAILANIRDDDDDASQIVALNELCEYISISTEESMVTFPMEHAVPLLVDLLGREDNPDIMLLAARALTFLADVFPPSSIFIIRHNAVPALCARLLTIEYIDLAEQCLQALEKLSHDHPSSLLRAGALIAVLSYIDFFQTGVQRVAVATAANICRGLTLEHVDAIHTAAPILIGLLRYSDAKIVDSACVALTRIAQTFSKNAAQMGTLCNMGLISSIVEMVSISEGKSISSQLSSSTFYGLIKLLSTCASGSRVVAESLLEAGISETLSKLMTTSPLLSAAAAGASAASPGNIALRSSDQLDDLVSLAGELLPPVPDTGMASSFSADVSRGTSATRRQQQQPAASSETAHASSLGTYLREHPASADRVTRDLLHIMIQVFGAGMTPHIKRESLNTLIKIIYHAPPDTLEAVLADIPISGLIAGMLASSEDVMAGKGLHLAEILMEKLPEVFAKYFMKEGVVHAMEELAKDRTSTGNNNNNNSNNESLGDGGSGGVLTRRRSRSEGQATEAASTTPLPLPHSGASGAKEGLAACTLKSRASQFLGVYFADSQGNVLDLQTDGIKNLSVISSKLPDRSAIHDLLALLSSTGDSSVSSFEFLSSGCLRSLRGYLHGADCVAANAERSTSLLDAASTPGVAADQGREGEKEAGGQWALLERLGHFVEAALPLGSGANPPMRCLVEKLLAVLAASEKFQVRLNAVSPAASSFSALYSGGGGGLFGFRGSLLSSSTGSSASASLSAGLAALSNPFKIRFVRHAEDSSLRDFGGSVVLIEPLASLTQVEDFLWNRVHRGDTTGKTTTITNADAVVDNMAKAAQLRDAKDKDAHQHQGGSGSRPRSRPSESRPIPEKKPSRLTRAQARAAAEAEVAAQGRDDEMEVAGDEDFPEGMLLDGGNTPRHAQETGAGVDAPDDVHKDASNGDGDGDGDRYVGDDDDMSDDDDDDDTMDGEDYVEGNSDIYEQDEGDMLDATMHVHDMHLNEETTSIPPAPLPDATAATMTAAAARGALSYAAAAATSSASSREVHRHRDGASPPPPKLAFYLDGCLLDPSMTIFQVVQAVTGSGTATAQTSSSNAGSRLWGNVHTLSYRKYDDCIEQREKNSDTAAMDAAPCDSAIPTASSALAIPPTKTSSSLDSSPLSDLLHPCSFLVSSPGGPLDGISKDVEDVLIVLHTLETINRMAPRLLTVLETRRGHSSNDKDVLSPGHIPREAFVSSRLVPKLSQQLKDVISICGGVLPPWCAALTTHARFLFSFEVRRRYLYCTSFGLNRALNFLQQSHRADHGGGDRDSSSASRIGRVHRQKVRISRDRVLDSAHRVFDKYTEAKMQLEVEFFGEAGSGLGPTLEFYTLLSHDLRRRSLGLWREGGDGTTHNTSTGHRPSEEDVTMETEEAGDADRQQRRRHIKEKKGKKGSALTHHGTVTTKEGTLDGTLDGLVEAPQGLFPCPLRPWGPLSAPSRVRKDAGSASKSIAKHFKLIGKATAKALQDGRLLDLPLSPVFYRLVLGRPVDLYDIKLIDRDLGRSLERLHAAQQAAVLSGSSPNIDGCSIEDLSLTFVLPGYPEYELCPGGQDVPVTRSALQQYIDAVVDATIGSGVAAQVEAYRAGFSSIFSLSSLDIFYEDEIEAMLCGIGESWTVQDLSSIIKFDHGYHADSAPVIALLETLVELDAEDQRRFLRFVTGTPRLPPGGLAALQPRLTVVRKLSAGMMAGIEPGSSLPPSSSIPPPHGVSGAGTMNLHAVDGDLPSVMTCANYLKLPPYSSKKVLKERLLYAIREGQGSFDLS